MPILDLNPTGVISQSGFTGATASNLQAIDGNRATGGVAGSNILVDIDDAPANFSTLTTVTLAINANTVGTVTRSKSATVELRNSSNTVLESFTVELTGTATTYTSSAFTRSATKSEIDGWRLFVNITESGGMSDTATVSIDRLWASIDYAAGATFLVKKFRFFNDDGNESGSTAAAAENTDITRRPYEVLRLRFGIEQTESDANEGLTRGFRIQYSTNGGSSWSFLGSQTESTDHLRAASSAFVSNGTATTSRLTGMTGTFVSGVVRDLSSTAVSITFTSSALTYTEIEWVIMIYGGRFRHNDEVLIRVVEAGTNDTSPTSVPTSSVSPKLNRTQRKILLG